MGSMGGGSVGPFDQALAIIAALADPAKSQQLIGEMRDQAANLANIVNRQVEQLREIQDAQAKLDQDKAELAVKAQDVQKLSERLNANRTDHENAVAAWAERKANDERAIQKRTADQNRRTQDLDRRVAEVNNRAQDLDQREAAVAKREEAAEALRAQLERATV